MSDTCHCVKPEIIHSDLTGKHCSKCGLWYDEAAWSSDARVDIAINEQNKFHSPLPFDDLEKLRIFKALRAEIIEWRKKRFPRGTFVRVSTNGNIGVVVYNGEPPPEQIPVMYENGNTWFVPMEFAYPIYRLSDVPRSARLTWLVWNGIKCQGHIRVGLRGHLP